MDVDLAKEAPGGRLAEAEGAVKAEAAQLPGTCPSGPPRAQPPSPPAPGRCPCGHRGAVRMRVPVPGWLVCQLLRPVGAGVGGQPCVQGQVAGGTAGPRPPGSTQGLTGDGSWVSLTLVGSEVSPGQPVAGAPVLVSCSPAVLVSLPAGGAIASRLPPRRPPCRPGPVGVQEGGSDLQGLPPSVIDRREGGWRGRQRALWPRTCCCLCGGPAWAWKGPPGGLWALTGGTRPSASRSPRWVSCRDNLGMRLTAETAACRSREAPVAAAVSG